MAETLKQKTARGLMWGGMSTALQQLLTLLFGIILARRLCQEDYGMIGMLTIFSTIAASMQEGGFIAALNRKEVVTQRDYNAVFWASVLTSIAFYTLFFFTAPLIARFYGEPRLTALARYSFLSFLIVSFSIAPRAYIFRNMMVRQSSIIGVVAVLLAGTVGVAMAYGGYAYWGLATQVIVFTLTVSTLNYWFSGWRPSLSIDLSPIRELLAFSSRLIATSIITAVNANLLTVVLGRFYTAYDVGNFTQASKWSTMGHSLITGTLYSIAQPVLKQAEGDSKRQRHIFRKLLRFTAFVSFPLMLGLSLVSEEFIVLLITDKWLKSAALLRWLAVAGAVMPVSYLFSNLLITRGRSRAYLWCTVGLLAVQMAAVLVCIPWGMERMVQAFAAVNIVWVAVWFALAKGEIGLRASEALRDVSPYIVVAAGAVVVAYVAAQNLSSPLLSLIVKIIVVAAIYPSVLWLLGSTILRESFLFITKRKLTED